MTWLIIYGIVNAIMATVIYNQWDKLMEMGGNTQSYGQVGKGAVKVSVFILFLLFGLPMLTVGLIANMFKGKKKGKV